MRRISFWALSTLSSLVLLFSYHTSTSGAEEPAATSSSYVAGTTPGASSSGSTTVTGDTVQTQWGPVQVQLTLDGDRITGVQVLQYPNGNGRDAQINSYALPILTRETVDQQSASIDMVSGATVTSVGYLQSLQSALDQAGL
jgi:uncharacterized protein with FMN-binding domain